MTSGSRRGAGVVYLVGAGPGDPSLITVRGARLLGKADVVVHDALVDPRLLSLAPPTAERLYAGKRAGAHVLAQAEINRLLIRAARSGRTVVRLKGGDPFVFGRGAEEASALRRAGLRFQVIPGVTAGLAAPAAAGIPVTHRELSSEVAFVTSHGASAEAPVEWARVAQARTLVIFMGVRTLAERLAGLVAAGRDPSTPAAIVQWGTTVRQRTVVGTLSTLAARAAEAGVTAPAVTVIGEVVRLRKELAWAEALPLFGAQVVVTRPAESALGLADALEELGAGVLLAPAIRRKPAAAAPLDRAVRALGAGRYAGALFTSPAAVEALFERIRAAGLDARLLSGTLVAAVGGGTAQALAAAGLTADVVPAGAGRGGGDALARALVRRLGRRRLSGARFVLPRAAGGREELARGLEAAGAIVDVLDAYRTVPAGAAALRPLRAALREGAVAAVTFASPSAVDAVVSGLGAGARSLLTRTRLVCIGPTTSAALAPHGLRPAALAEGPTDAALAAAVAAALGKRPARRSNR